VRIDGRPVNTRAVEIRVSNTGVLGMPPYHVFENSRLDDGLVEVLSLPRWSFGELARAAVGVAGHHPDRAIRLLGQGRSVTIATRHPLPVAVDGDITGNTPVRITLHPRAVNLIVPSA